MSKDNFFDENRQNRAERHKPTPEQIAAAKEAHRKYMREYRQRNPDKVRAANQRYWLKRAQAEKNQPEP